MREASLVENDPPKSQSKHPTKHHLSMYFIHKDERMPLSLHVVFSCFPSKKMLVIMLHNYDNDTLFLTTGNVDSNNKIYSENYRAVLDQEGNTI